MVAALYLTQDSHFCHTKPRWRDLPGHTGVKTQSLLSLDEMKLSKVNLLYKQQNRHWLGGSSLPSLPPNSRPNGTQKLCRELVTSF